MTVVTSAGVANRLSDRRPGGVSGRVGCPVSATMSAMTDLMTRPILRVRATAEPARRPMALSAVVAGVAAAGVGLVLSVAVAVGVWFSGDTGSFGAAVRVGAFGWLLSNGSGLEVSGVSIGAIPLGLLLLWGFVVYRAGRWAGMTSAVRHAGDVAVGALLLTAGYAGTGLAVSVVARTGSAHVGLVRTMLMLGAVGLVFGGLGVVRGSDATGPLLEMLPQPVRAAVAGAVASVATMVGAAGLVVVVSLVVHFSQAVTLQEGLAAGTVGSLTLAVIGMASVPNAVLCAGAFVAGPGFQVGTDTTVAPGDVQLGRMPGLPILAALPSNTGDAWWQALLVLLPVISGAVAGLVTLRRDPVYGLDQAALRGAVSGLLGGVAFGAMTWLATGAVGPGRMQDIGPDVLATTVVCGLAFLVGGAVSACATRWWQLWPVGLTAGRTDPTDLTATSALPGASATELI